MELSQKKIYNDIEEIKTTIECSKRKLSGPYRLFLGYGIVQGIIFILNLTGSIIWNPDNGIPYFNFAVEMAGAGAVVILYLLVYGREKHTSNKYYLTAISIWGLIAAILPFLMLAARLVIIVWGKNFAVHSMYLLEEYKMLINMLLVCTAMIMTGYVVDKKWLTVLSMLLLFCFVIINIFPDVYYSLSIKGIERQVTLAGLFYLLVNIWGYIGLGLLLYREKNADI